MLPFAARQTLPRLPPFFSSLFFFPPVFSIKRRGRAACLLYLFIPSQNRPKSSCLTIVAICLRFRESLLAALGKNQTERAPLARRRRTLWCLFFSGVRNDGVTRNMMSKQRTKSSAVFLLLLTPRVSCRSPPEPERPPNASE